MRALLDTHSLLWFVLGDPQLSGTARSIASDLSNEILISPASYWEIAIKVTLGKYSLTSPYEIFMHRAIFGNGFRILPIELAHTSELIALPLHHRDPFDRLLVAQSIAEGIPLISADAALDS